MSTIFSVVRGNLRGALLNIEAVLSDVDSQWLISISVARRRYSVATNMCYCDLKGYWHMIILLIVRFNVKASIVMIYDIFMFDEFESIFWPALNAVSLTSWNYHCHKADLDLKWYSLSPTSIKVWAPNTLRCSPTATISGLSITYDPRRRRCLQVVSLLQVLISRCSSWVRY